MRCPEETIGAAAAAFGAGVLIGGCLPGGCVKLLLGLALIAAGILLLKTAR